MPPSPEAAPGIYRGLADLCAAERDAANESWALRKALEAEARLALQAAGSLAAAPPAASEATAPADHPWLDAVLLHHGQGRVEAAFQAFARGLDESRARKDASVLTEVQCAASALLGGSFGAGHPGRVAGARESLRAFLRLWFTESPGPGPFNLVLVDALAAAAPGKGPLAALDALLDHRPRSVPEDFQAVETCILWIAGQKAVFITGEDSWSRIALPAVMALGALCAHYAFPETEAGPRPAGDWRPAPAYDPASVRDRECAVIEQLPLFANAMRYLTDKPAFTDPAGFLGTARLLVRHAGEYRRSDSNRNDTWTPLVTAHCQTNAYANDFLHFLNRLYNPPYPLPGTRGVLGDMSGEHLDRVVRQLDEKGYFKFESRVPGDLCDGLIRHGREGECVIHGDGVPKGMRGRYDGKNPKGSKYQLDADVSLKTPEFQALLADHSILSVTQAYLGSRVTMETCAMWWLPLYGQAPSFAAAQQFHFDMDRWKWLNWFLYLTDVNTGTAPHTIIQKSHHRLAKPDSILSRGYVRVSDEELAQHYPREDFLELTGPVGTLMAVDTRVWHKAKFPTTGERLILEIVCATSMFGNDSLAKGPRLPERPIPALASLMSSYPRLYSQYA